MLISSVPPTLKISPNTGGGDAASPTPEPERLPFASASFGELCKFGLAMTWPLVLIALGALGVLVAVLMRH
jgi:hypothetical protein